MDGDALIVGAPAIGYELPGAVYVFRRVDGLWVDERKIAPPESSQNAGIRVAASGDALAFTSHAPGLIGHVNVYTRTGDGGWLPSARFEAVGVSESGFNRCLAMCGRTMVVCAPEAQNGNKNRGAVYIYAESGRKWALQRRLTDHIASHTNGYGYSADIEGDMLVVGNIGSGAAVPNGGAVYVYERAGRSGWAVKGVVTASDAQEVDLFGLNAKIGRGSMISLVNRAGHPYWTAIAYIHR